MLERVEVDLIVVLGTTEMPVSQILKLGRGAVVELDARINDDAQIFVNGKAIGAGEIVVQEEKLAISIKEIYSSAKK
jgi:flagellar motor switch protein FliN/FliY